MLDAILLSICLTGLVTLCVFIFQSAPKIGRDLEPGDTYEVKVRWSGDGIASESRKDGGTYYATVEAVRDDGSVKYNGKWVSRGDFFGQITKSHHSAPGARFQQSCRHVPRYIGKPDVIPMPDIGGNRGLHDSLRMGGIVAASEYLKHASKFP